VLQIMKSLSMFEFFINKKSLKISKEQSESVNRRTDNTMTKRKRTNNDLQTIHIKQKIE
jgi:hypothetical protein